MGSLTFLKGDDVTFTWESEYNNHVVDFISQKMKEGYKFYSAKRISAELTPCNHKYTNYPTFFTANKRRKKEVVLGKLISNPADVATYDSVCI